MMQSIYISLKPFEPNDYTQEASYRQWKESRFEYGSVLLYQYKIRNEQLVIDWYWHTNDCVETIFENFFTESSKALIKSHCNHTFTRKIGDTLTFLNVFTDKTRTPIDISDPYTKLMFTRKFQ